MAVYTKINQKEINIINKNFNIDKYKPLLKLYDKADILNDLV